MYILVYTYFVCLISLDFLDYYFLNYQGYYNLLFRMLNSKRYCFIKTSSDMKTVFIEKDKDRNITYFQYLKSL